MGEQRELTTPRIINERGASFEAEDKSELDPDKIASLELEEKRYRIVYIVASVALGGGVVSWAILMVVILRVTYTRCGDRIRRPKFRK